MKCREFILLFSTFLGVSAFLICLSYPGTMTNDSVGWLYAARTGNYGGTQPVGAALMWSLIDPIWPGPMGFVAVNIFMLTTGLLFLFYLIQHSALQASLATILIIGYPTVLTLLPVAWRDITGLAITVVMLGIAVLAARFATRSKVYGVRFKAVFIILIVLSFIGTVFRANHAAGILPILALPIGVYISHRWQLGKLTVTILALILSTLILITTSLSGFHVSKSMAVSKSYSFQAPTNYRLALLSDRVNRNLFPAELYPKLSLEHIRFLLNSVKKPYSFVFWRAFSRNDREELPRLVTEADTNHLRQSYYNAIFNYPREFLSIRASEILQWFDFRKSYASSSWVRHKVPPRASSLIKMNFEYERPEWSQRLLKKWAALNKIFINRNPLMLIGLGLALTSLAFILKLPNRVLMLVTSTSSLTHFLSVAMVVANFQFRYGHQAYFFALVTVVLFMMALFNLFTGRSQLESSI